MQAEDPLNRNADKLTIDDNVIFNGICLYVPPRLHHKVFNILHDENHSGIKSMINALNSGYDGQEWMPIFGKCTKIYCLQKN